MNLTPQHQALNMQATALQHQLQNSMHGGANPTAQLMHHEVMGLKNDIAAGKNTVTLNERMKKINTMIQNDQRVHYQPPTSNYQQQTHFGGHFDAMHPGGNMGMPNQSAMHPASYGPAFSHNESSHMQYGLRQMSATLNRYAKF